MNIPLTIRIFASASLFSIASALLLLSGCASHSAVGDALARPSNAAVSIADTPDQIQFVNPADLAGKKPAFLEYCDIAAPLEAGHWLLVLYHHDCPLCRQAVPHYMRQAESGQIDGDLKLAFIEAPPFSDSDTSSLIPRSGPWLSGKLDKKFTWFVPMLTRIEIKDGLVIRAWSGDEESLRSAG
jgi:hypothetical protein